MRGGVGHAPSATGWAEAAALAREGDEPFEVAFVAAQTEEAVLEDAAAKEGAELLLDERRSGSIALASAVEEGLELVAHGPVEERVLRPPRGVLGRAVVGCERCARSG